MSHTYHKGRLGMALGHLHTPQKRANSCMFFFSPHLILFFINAFLFSLQLWRVLQIPDRLPVFTVLYTRRYHLGHVLSLNKLR